MNYSLTPTVQLWAMADADSKRWPNRKLQKAVAKREREREVLFWSNSRDSRDLWYNRSGETMFPAGKHVQGRLF